ncbi:MAG TPA: DUF3099 domain-containing protein [Galbitalea sp.]
MNKQPIQSATSLPPSPDAERRTRMIKYTVAMVLRLICFLLVCLIPLSWWTLIPLIGAVILPYVAVVLANTVIQSGVTPVERPGGLVPVPQNSAPQNPVSHTPGADG